MDTHQPIDLSKIAGRSDFRKLSSERNFLGFSLALVMALIYFTFISIVAFSPETLARPIVPGSAVSIGILAGIATMASGFILTAIYVVYASSRIEPMVDDLKGNVR